MFWNEVPTAEQVALESPLPYTPPTRVLGVVGG